MPTLERVFKGHGHRESPYKVLSAMVTLNRPAGMAVMALLFKILEHGASGWQQIGRRGKGPGSGQRGTWLARRAAREEAGRRIAGHVVSSASGAHRNYACADAPAYTTETGVDWFRIWQLHMRGTPSCNINNNIDQRTRACSFGPWAAAGPTSTRRPVTRGVGKPVEVAATQGAPSTCQAR